MKYIKIPKILIVNNYFKVSKKIKFSTDQTSNMSVILKNTDFKIHGLELNTSSDLLSFCCLYTMFLNESFTTEDEKVGIFKIKYSEFAELNGVKEKTIKQKKEKINKTIIKLTSQLISFESTDTTNDKFKTISIFTETDDDGKKVDRFITFNVNLKFFKLIQRANIVFHEEESKKMKGDAYKKDFEFNLNLSTESFKEIKTEVAKKLALHILSHQYFQFLNINKMMEIVGYNKDHQRKHVNEAIKRGFVALKDSGILTDYKISTYANGKGINSISIDLNTKYFSSNIQVEKVKKVKEDKNLIFKKADSTEKTVDKKPKISNDAFLDLFDEGFDIPQKQNTATVLELDDFIDDVPFPA